MTHASARYVLDDGEPLTVMHHGGELHLQPDKPEVRSIPAAQASPRPSQPPGRAPAHRLGSEDPR